MKRILLLIISITITQFAFATTYNVAISGFTYTTPLISAVVGDTINIQASGNHPLVQVDSVTWMAGANTPLVGGFSSITNYQLIVSSVGTIYYVCNNHVGMGMKGKIVVSGGTTGLAENIITTPEAKVYPTLISDGYFNVTLTNAAKCQTILMYNMAGQLVEKHTLSNAQNLINTELPAGLYVYTVGNAANTTIIKTGKVIITK